MRMLCHLAFEHFISHLTRSLSLQEDNASFAVKVLWRSRIRMIAEDASKPRALFRSLALLPRFIILYFDAHPHIIAVEEERGAFRLQKA
jgi:hypothetical protein